MGIYSPHSNQIFEMNLKKLFFLSSLIILFISHVAYFIFEAKFVEENGFKSFYESFSGLIALIIFSLNVWQMPVILQLIKMYDAFIEKSEPNPIDFIFESVQITNKHITLIDLFIFNDITRKEVAPVSRVRYENWKNVKINALYFR